MDAPIPSLWDKIDETLVVAPLVRTGEGDEPNKADEWRRYWKFRRPLLDGIGIAFWLYAILKLFAADVDRALVGDVADYRGFLFLGIALLIAVLFRRTGAILAGYAYIAGYPLVLVCWKLPKALYRAKSPVAFLAVANAVASLVGDTKHSVTVAALAAFAALAIALSHSGVILAVASAAMAFLLVQAIYRTIRFSVAPSRFLRIQQRAIRRAVDSALMKQMTSPSDELRRPEIQKFDESQQQSFLQNLSHGVLAHRSVLYWAHQLDNYRRSPASLFFNSLSYLWLIVRAVLALAFLNLALFHADAAAYNDEAGPGFLTFVRYVIAGLYGGEIDALRPASDLANTLSIATFGVGLVVGGSLLLSSALSFRAARDESDIRETVNELRRQGDRLDERMRAEYQVSAAEATERLEQLRFGLMGIITYLSERIPKEYEETPGGTSP